MSFQIHALSSDGFEHLWSLNDSGLRENRACRYQVNENPGTPCRISLKDAKVGETVILTHYMHHACSSPFRASHAIYVRPDVEQAKPAMNQVPSMIESRLLSVRGFNSSGYMLDADVVEGNHFEGLAERLFGNSEIDYLHIHTAKLGCYLACATRISGSIAPNT